MNKKQPSVKVSSPATERYVKGVPQSFVDRDLMKVNPLKEQFEPTDQSPVRQHVKMAGGC